MQSCIYGNIVDQMQAPKFVVSCLSGHSICGNVLKKVSFRYYISYFSAACIANCMTINFKDIHTQSYTADMCAKKKKKMI